MIDTAPQSIQVISIPPQAHERWRLSDRYVEDVWSEFLGPTATMMARRLGRLAEERPAGIEVDPADLGASIGVGRSLVEKAFRRLDRFGIVHSDLDRRIVGVSGHAPSVGDDRLFRLSEAGLVAHEQLTAATEVAPIGRASELLAAPATAIPDRGLVPLALR